MIQSLVNRLKLHYRRWRFRPGVTISKFIARDVKREILVADASHIDEGYVTAQVRTINVLYQSKGLVPETDFGEPEILHLNRAWKWGGQPWGGTEPERPRIPVVSAEDLQRTLSLAFPDSKFQLEQINPSYSSWRLLVSLADKKVEFVWGPLSGFGGIDPTIKNEDIFAHCDQYLYSKEAAIAYARKVLCSTASLR